MTKKRYHVCLFCKSSNCCPGFNFYTMTHRSILQKPVLIQYCKADCSFISTGLPMFLFKSILLLQRIFQFVILNSVSSLIHFHIVIHVRSGSIMTRLSLDPSLKILNKTGCRYSPMKYQWKNSFLWWCVTNTLWLQFFCSPFFTIT